MTASPQLVPSLSVVGGNDWVCGLGTSFVWGYKEQRQPHLRGLLIGGRVRVATAP